MWPAIRIAYGWVHRAARLLENEDELTGQRGPPTDGGAARRDADDQATVGTLQPAVAHFLKVSASYWPGLFHCYDIPGVPRTNNVLEQFFGSVRYHQRRASGRIRASAATVVRGSVRALASTASRLHLFGEYDLRHPNLDAGGACAIPSSCARKHADNRDASARIPTAYLAALEASLLKPEFAVLEKRGRLVWTCPSGT